jgi:serine/threonine protein kinase
MLRRFSKIYPRANPHAIDMLEKMLTFNPKNRITVEQALAHPYLKSLHDPRDEPTASVHCAVHLLPRRPSARRCLEPLSSSACARCTFRVGEEG